MRFLALAVAGFVCAGAASAADAPDAGERAFQRCYSCHSVEGGETDTPGPNLRNVIGRRAGTLPGYEFSQAMVAAGKKGLVWTREAVDALIADSERFVPGTTMSMPPLTDAKLRREVIDYLERAR
jgi:cytochrome c2